MKKKVSIGLMCSLVVCISVLCAVLTSCEDVSGKKPKPHVSMNGFIPDGIEDSDLSELPSDCQEEIRALYGCYWMDGPKDNCVKIDDTELIVCSTAMSYSYENIRWAGISPSMWVCFAYHKFDRNYSEDGRKVILKFTKDAGGIKLYQRVQVMNQNSGPFKKDKDFDEKDDFYVYDKNDSSCPKMKKPNPL